MSIEDFKLWISTQSCDADYHPIVNLFEAWLPQDASTTLVLISLPACVTTLRFFALSLWFCVAHVEFRQSIRFGTVSSVR